METRNTHLEHVFSHVSTEIRYICITSIFTEVVIMILCADIVYVSFFRSLLRVLQLELLAQKPMLRNVTARYTHNSSLTPLHQSKGFFFSVGLK